MEQRRVNLGRGLGGKHTLVARSLRTSLNVQPGGKVARLKGGDTSGTGVEEFLEPLVDEKTIHEERDHRKGGGVACVKRKEKS